MARRDQSAFDTLVGSFTHLNGHIVDQHSEPWVLWHTTDLYAWWHSFEDQCQTPLGRKLMNAFADHEEYLLNLNATLSSGWFSKKRRQHEAILHRWSTHGWGGFDVFKNSASTLLFSPIAAGLALATVEGVSEQRHKVEWTQLNQRMIQFEFSPSDTRLPSAPPPPRLPWTHPLDHGLQSPHVFSELQHNGTELSLEGEVVCMLPVGAFTRLLHTCRAYPHALGKEHQDSWQTPGMEAGDRSVMLMVVSSMSGLVGRGERPIYLESHKSWNSLIEHYLIQFGWGAPSSIEPLDSEHGVRFFLSPTATFPFLVGWLVAMWERGYGIPSKFSLEEEGSNWVLDIESRHAYN